MNRAGDRGPVNPEQPGQCRVRELEPQVNEGDDDPVGKRQGMVRPGAPGALPLVAAPFAQPVFLRSLPGAGELLDQLAQPAAPDPGPDTM
jgi:hypothetical protein